MELRVILVLLFHQVVAVCQAQITDMYGYTKHFFDRSLHSSASVKHVRSRSFLHCCTLCCGSRGCRGVAYSGTDCWLINRTQTSCEFFDEECSTCEHADYKVMTYTSTWDGSCADCKSLLEQGYTDEGVYTLSPLDSTPFQAFCDMTNGGWTVFQRRVDDSVDFRRGWEDYVAGFDDLHGNFWAGLDNIHAMTVFQDTELLVTMDTFEGESDEAHYSSFYVDDAASGYRMTVGGYSGTAGDSMALHNLKKFSTFDNDQDDKVENCAETYCGGWWYVACIWANPNGLYLHPSDSQYGNGVVWKSFKGFVYSLKTVELKVKRIN